MNKTLVPFLVILLMLIACQSKEDQIKEIVQNNVETNEFNGYLHVEMQGKTLYNGAIQSPALSLPRISDSTKVYLASLTKLFTKLAILKLQEQGQIDLYTPISVYRPHLKAGFAQQVKVIDLLNMRSGLPREMTQDSLPFVQWDSNEMAGPFIDALPDFTLSFEPGTKEEYSNLNYWILGAIIEQITGMNLHEAFTQLIFQELNMRHSGLFNSGLAIQKGHAYVNEQWQLDSSDYEGRYASGGCYSTVKDLRLLATTLSEGHFLNPDNRQLLESTANKVEVYGSLPGNSNVFILDFEQHYSIIFLNTVGLRDLSAMTQIKNQIEDALGIDAAKRSKRVVKLNSIEALNDSLLIEKSLKTWISAVETGDTERIYQAIKAASVKGSMSETDRTWEDLSQLNKTLPNFRALGYRWVKDQEPKGLEVWFGSDQKGKLAIRWLFSETDSTLVENLFVMPDDMTWQGNAY